VASLQQSAAKAVSTDRRRGFAYESPDGVWHNVRDSLGGSSQRMPYFYQFAALLRPFPLEEKYEEFEQSGTYVGCRRTGFGWLRDRSRTGTGREGS
jgi:hypothetical protein